jgi:hypothetical protein
MISSSSSRSSSTEKKEINKNGLVSWCYFFKEIINNNGRNA